MQRYGNVRSRIAASAPASARARAYRLSATTDYGHREHQQQRLASLARIRDHRSAQLLAEAGFRCTRDRHVDVCLLHRALLAGAQSESPGVR
jgi:hypothetical protein